MFKIQQEIFETYGSELHSDIIKLCHFLELPLHYNHKGPKLFTNYQRVGVIVIFMRSRKSLRDFVKQLYELKWIDWLGLKQLPKKSTLHDWLKLFDLKLIRKLLFEMIKEEQPSLMAIDATGIDSWQRSRHYERRVFEGKQHMPYAKLGILIDTKTMLIHDHVLRIKPRHDTIGAKTMLSRMNVKKVKILGDKGYDSEKLHEITFSKGNIFYAPVRKSSRKLPRGKHRKRCFKGDDDYSRRNTVESTFHSLKFTRISCLRSKKHHMKKREMAWCILVYNLEVKNKKLFLYVTVAYATFPDRPSKSSTSNKIVETVELISCVVVLICVTIFFTSVKFPDMLDNLFCVY